MVGGRERVELQIRKNEAAGKDKRKITHTHTKKTPPTVNLREALPCIYITVWRANPQTHKKSIKPDE